MQIHDIIAFESCPLVPIDDIGGTGDPAERTPEGHNMPEIRFSDSKIKTLSPGEFSDPRYPNLRLRVGKSQKREVSRATWGLRLRRQADGSRPWLKLGYWPELSCAAADLKYKEETARIAQGKPADDLEQRIRELERQLRQAKRAAGQLMPFEQLVERFLTDYVPRTGVPLAKTTHRNYRDLLERFAVPEFRGQDASSLVQTDVQLLIDTVARRTRAQGIKLYMVLKSMLRWALRRELISAHPMELVNSPGSYTARERVLDKDELRRIWHIFGDIKNRSLSKSLKLVILTWQRRAEVGHLPWDEIADDGQWWYLRRTKNRKRSAVFLAPTSRAILESQRGRSAVYCFPARQKGEPISPKHMSTHCWNLNQSLLKDGVIRERFTIHDLRRTGATLAREQGRIGRSSSVSSTIPRPT